MSRRTPDELTAWRNERRQGDDKPPDYYRSAGERDRDRLLYSSALRRLGGVTQVVAAREEGHLFHNRLTHSLKVAQLARRIAQKLQCDIRKSRRLQGLLIDWGGLDPDVAESAGLAHDLGHPPFGHIAEKVLANAIRNRGAGPLDGFEGNAQSFRVVTKLSAIDDTVAGLNLTRATLNAILKYPWTAERGEKKYGVYSTERVDFDWARTGSPRAEFERALEAEVMDWADDIAYAVHDVEDFYRAGLVPLGPQEFDPIYARVDRDWDVKHHGPKPMRPELHTAAGVIALFPVTSPFRGTKGERSKLRSFASQRIGTLVNATHFTEHGFEVDRPARVQAELFKALTQHYVINNAALATQQVGQRLVVLRLYTTYANALTRGGEMTAIFPPRTLSEVALVSGPRADQIEAVRVVADVISGMTETQAQKVYQRLRGVDSGALLDPAVL